MKTSELTGAALDWAVAKAEGKHIHFWPAVKGIRDRPEITVLHPNTEWTVFHPTVYWSQGGPIIEREKIDLHHIGSAWTASIYAPKWHARDHEQFGPTPLIAAMRCFVASRLSDEVDVPKELL